VCETVRTWKTHRKTEIEIDTTDTQTHRQTHRQTDRQTDRRDTVGEEERQRGTWKQTFRVRKCKTHN
jgi:hypothetical protein